MLDVKLSAQGRTLEAACVDVTFFMLDDEYTAMGLLPERDSSERALILF